MPAAVIKPDLLFRYFLIVSLLFTIRKVIASIPSSIFFLFLAVSLFLPPVLKAQDYSYVQYNTKDGLAGSTIYDMCQDKDGFIWFATEAGLSRFDGTRFKNFTTADGLPEVEILRLYADHKGRVWIIPFKNTICYHYQAKIYTSANDSLLKKVKLNAVMTCIAGDVEDNIFFSCQGSGSYILRTKPGEEEFIDLKKYGRNFTYGHANFLNRPGFFLNTHDSLFLLNKGRLEHWPIRAYGAGNLTTRLGHDHTAKTADIPAFPHNMFSTLDATKKYYRTILTSTNEGAWLTDTLRFDRLSEVFLKGKQIYSGIVDYEKNMWFGTAGEGVYKLVSRSFKTYTFSNSKTSEVFSLEKLGEKIVVGSAFNKAYFVNGTKIDSASFLNHFYHATQPNNRNRLVCMKRLSNNNLLLGFDLFLYKRDKTGSYVNYEFPIKGVDEINPDTLLVGIGRNVIRVREKDLTILDTVFPYRSTAVKYYNNDYYIGTVSGLYMTGHHKPMRFWGDSVPSLRYRIASFAQPSDGSLWVATYGGGIVGIKNGRIIGHLTSKQGLSSDICRSLFAYKNFLWVGTDKGLNKIDINKASYPIHRYSVADGLPSNIINAIYVDSLRVYVGSPAGLTYFDEREVSNFSRCDLRILDIAVSGRSQLLQSTYELGYNDNNLRIEFAGISFKSAGDILYRYRLQGLKDSWDSTRQNVLEYPSLPSGQYTLELQAINKFGVLSNSVVIPFLIDAPFWQAWWFKLMLVGLTIGLTAALVTWRFNIVRRREQEKVGLQQKINELEQMALLSQMNPHFIFNCLNSIQSFIINNDLETTNEYLTEFAHLIRQTMDCAEKGAISITHEIKYLSRYIELEKMRFGHSFDYSISVDEAIDTDNTYLPSMILQPYVENSIRHGVRHKTDGRGLIEIGFRQQGEQLLCIVEDNGIGRLKARQLRSQVHVEYQSKGMTLAAERVKALNRQHNEFVAIEVIDKVDAEKAPTGTRIVVYFSHQILTKLS
jgi:signal transduction histidine kinase